MERLFSAIPAVLKGLEPNKDAYEALVFAAWTQCAGLSLSERTQPIRFADKRLVIAVEDKTWQQNLEALSPKMLARLNDALGSGTVRFIEFRCDEARFRTGNYGR